jgi:hypothetical protein
MRRGPKCKRKLRVKGLSVKIEARIQGFRTTDFKTKKVRVFSQKAKAKGVSGTLNHLIQV